MHGAEQETKATRILCIMSQTDQYQNPHDQTSQDTQLTDLCIKIVAPRLICDATRWSQCTPILDVTKSMGNNFHYGYSNGKQTTWIEGEKSPCP